jgi:hypothetical protein
MNWPILYAESSQCKWLWAHPRDQMSLIAMAQLSKSDVRIQSITLLVILLLRRGRTAQLGLPSSYQACSQVFQRGSRATPSFLSSLSNHRLASAPFHRPMFPSTFPSPSSLSVQRPPSAPPLLLTDWISVSQKGRRGTNACQSAMFGGLDQVVGASCPPARWRKPRKMTWCSRC